MRPWIATSLLVLSMPAAALAQDAGAPPAKPPPANPPGAKPGDTKPAPAPPAPKPPAPKAAKPATPPALPPAAARLWIVAPAAEGTWTFRIDNEGEKPIRIPADVRLLRFEVETTEGKRTKKVKCSPPAGFRPSAVPDSRALLLAPGESYIESFDPKLICFGKDAAALAGGSKVITRFGWDPPGKWSKKLPDPPYAVEGTEQPPTVAPLRELLAPTMVLSYAAPPPPPPKPAAKPSDASDKPAPEDKKDKAADKAGKAPGKGDKGDKADKSAEKAADKPAEKPAKPPIEDANAPKLELTADRYSNAQGPRQVSVTLTVTNVGHRATTAALRSRMISFRVEGADRRMTCDAGPTTKAIPRDMYRTIKPKDKVSFTVLLAEVCPREAFGRAGMYRVDATLHANESGSELGLQAYTGVSEATSPTYVRLLEAPEPFYTEKPKAVPTPKLEPRDDVVVTGE